jgi:hypothetical protein
MNVAGEVYLSSTDEAPARAWGHEPADFVLSDDEVLIAKATDSPSETESRRLMPRLDPRTR